MMLDDIQQMLGRFRLAVPVKVKRLEADARLPTYGRPGDAGLDIHTTESHILLPGERRLFRTGIALEIPPGTVALVWDRSGLAAKHGITAIGGVIDHTYRGECRCALLNTSDEPYEVKRGDRIAQILIQPVCTAEIEEVEELSDSIRGAGGFGSSGR